MIILDEKSNYKIEVKLVVEDFEERRNLWQIYDEAYQLINTESPCKQSYSKEEYREVMEDAQIQKIILYVNNKVVGLGLLTNKLNKVPWISEPFFEKHFFKYYRKERIYYLKSLSIVPDYQGKIYGLKLLKYIINLIPKDSIGAFDCSERINEAMPLYGQRAAKIKPINNQHIDKQVYWVFEWFENTGITP